MTEALAAMNAEDFMIGHTERPRLPLKADYFIFGIDPDPDVGDKSPKHSQCWMRSVGGSSQLGSWLPVCPSSAR